MPLRIGLVKAISPLIDISRLQRSHLLKGGGRIAGGVFQETDDGGFVWAVTVTSPGADGIRLHFSNFSIPEDADLYFYNLEGEVRGPYKGQGPNGDGEFWTNTVFSDTGVIVLRYFGKYTAQDLRNVSFTITELGHIGRGRGILSPVPKSDTWGNDQCGNESCVIDANSRCGNLGPATDAAKAVAKMEWIQGAFIFTCTGGLIADTDTGTPRNLFLTANHCLSKNNNARNLETFFFYTTSSCEGNCPVSPTPHTTGATVLATGKKGDFTLLELNGNPPAGVVFLGWNNSPVAFTNGADLYRISNPNFGPQVFSHHQVDTRAGTCTQWPRGQRIYSHDVEGATDGGSSGAPVVNSNSEVVGQLSGACGFNPNDVCDADSNSTVDGALAFYYDKVAQFLDPSPGGGCSSDPECDDGLFCNGVETCDSGICQAGLEQCSAADQSCDEDNNQCITATCTGPLPPGADCIDDVECCSNKCKGRPGFKTCR